MEEENLKKELKEKVKNNKLTFFKWIDSFIKLNLSIVLLYILGTNTTGHFIYIRIWGLYVLFGQWKI